MPLDKCAARGHKRAMLSEFRADLLACLRFFSRLPLPPDDGAMPDLARCARALPAAGALLGACGALVLLLARGVGLAPPVAATLAVAALLLATGALHEDGLADMADGFGGGATRARKLENMRDSRLGSYGASALLLALLLRIFALAALTERGAGLAVLALIASGATSRAAALLPLYLLPPARGDGAGAAARPPAPAVMRAALLFAAAFALTPVFAGAGLRASALAFAAALFAAVGVAKLAEKQIGGYTGDVLGAAQQSAEVAALLLLSVG
jgi:adenosylcobinamide-GDP ribazoletransferase